MQLISFAWTTPAIIARRKTCTRRDWKPHFALKHKEGQICQPTNKVLYAGGHKIPGLIRLTEDVYQEHIREMPESDFEAEGFAYMDEIRAPVVAHWRDAGCATWREAFDFWKTMDHIYWVVRFDYFVEEDDLFRPRTKTVAERLQEIKDQLK